MLLFKACFLCINCFKIMYFIYFIYVLISGVQQQMKLNKETFVFQSLIAPFPDVLMASVLLLEVGLINCLLSCLFKCMFKNGHIVSYIY